MTTNSKPLGQIIMMGQSETMSSSLIIFITLFSAGLPAVAMDVIMQRENYFPKLNQRILEIFHPILLCRITDRAPLKTLQNQKLSVLLKASKLSVLSKKKKTLKPKVLRF